MESDTVFVLDDPHRELEQLQDDRGGLGLGQFGMHEDFRAQGMVQDIAAQEKNKRTWLARKR